MDQRTLIDRLLSPAGFGVVLLLFLFPFLTVSCASTSTEGEAANIEHSLTFTGIDLIVGGSPDVSFAGSDGSEATVEYDEAFGDDYGARPLVIAAAAIIFAGMIIGLVFPPARRAWPSAAAAVGAVVLLAVEVFAIAPGRAEDALSESMSALGEPAESQVREVFESGVVAMTTRPAYGFWIAIVLLLGLAAWQAHIAYHGRTAPSGGTEPAPSDAAPSVPHGAPSVPLGGAPSAGAPPESGTQA
jgi:hypothetical protein